MARKATINLERPKRDEEVDWSWKVWLWLVFFLCECCVVYYRGLECLYAVIYPERCGIILCCFIFVWVLFVLHILVLLYRYKVRTKWRRIAKPFAYSSKQWDAVTIQLGCTMVPPHMCSVRNRREICQGRLFGIASRPPTTLVLLSCGLMAGTPQVLDVAYIIIETKVIIHFGLKYKFLFLLMSSVFSTTCSVVRIICSPGKLWSSSIHVDV